MATQALIVRQCSLFISECSLNCSPIGRNSPDVSKTREARADLEELIMHNDYFGVVGGQDFKAIPNTSDWLRLPTASPNLPSTGASFGPSLSSSNSSKG